MNNSEPVEERCFSGKFGSGTMIQDGYLVARVFSDGSIKYEKGKVISDKPITAVTSGMLAINLLTKDLPPGAYTLKELGVE